MTNLRLRATLRRTSRAAVGEQRVAAGMVMAVMLMACTPAASAPTPTELGQTTPVGPSPTITSTPTMAPSPTPFGPQSAGTITLSDEGCAHVGPGKVVPGQISIMLANETAGQFDLDVWLLDERHSYEELAGHVAEEQRRHQAGEAPLGHPRFAELVAERTVEADARGDLETELAPGVYGMVCILFAAQEVFGGIWAGGPLVVGPEEAN
jgi:hypothetical protein